MRHQSATLAQYVWLGQAVHRRDTTCDYPVSTKPKFRADYQRDGLMRITRLTHTHQTLDQADSGYNDLGSWDYSYDAASNLLTADQTGGMGHLDADRVYGYDTLHRLITDRLTLDTRRTRCVPVLRTAGVAGAARQSPALLTTA